MRLTGVTILRAAAAALLVAALASAAQAQRDRRGEREMEERELVEREERAAREREAKRQALEAELSKPAPRRGPPKSSPQIGADFMRIQVVNDALAETASRPPAPDLKAVAKSVGEIQKLAERLKANLELPEPDAGGAPPAPESTAEGPDLKKSLGELDKLVLGFVRSPVFTNPAVFDLRHSKRAALQPDEIIRLSARLKREVDQLRKTPRDLG